MTYVVIFLLMYCEYWSQYALHDFLGCPMVTVYFKRGFKSMRVTWHLWTSLPQPCFSHPHVMSTSDAVWYIESHSALGHSCSRLLSLNASTSHHQLPANHRKYHIATTVTLNYPTTSSKPFKPEHRMSSNPKSHSSSYTPYNRRVATMTPEYNPTVLEIYHFCESLNSIQEAFEDIVKGFKKFEAGVQNLRVLFEKVEESTTQETISAAIV